MPETIGQRLQQTRLARQISLEKASEATRVRVIYLQALENDDFSAMSSAAQGRGFLRLYADFLGVDLNEAVTEVRQGGISSPPAAVVETPLPVTIDAPPASEPLSAPSADQKPVRRGFWARLLRRAAPEPFAEVESAPEEESPASEKPAALPIAGETSTASEENEVLPVAGETSPAPEEIPPARPARARSAAKKVSEAKSVPSKKKPKTKPIPKPAGKKKQPLKRRSSR